MNVYRIEDGESHWIAAPSEEDALRFQAESFEYTVEKYKEEFDPVVYVVQADSDLTVTNYDEPQHIMSADGMFEVENPEYRVTKKASQWASEADKPSIIATTAY
jgi:hypothetical protein